VRRGQAHARTGYVLHGGLVCVTLVMRRLHDRARRIRIRFGTRMTNVSEDGQCHGEDRSK
jgi:hypothetical protein